MKKFTLGSLFVVFLRYSSVPRSLSKKEFSLLSKQVSKGFNMTFMSHDPF